MKSWRSFRSNLLKINYVLFLSLGFAMASEPGMGCGPDSTYTYDILFKGKEIMVEGRFFGHPNIWVCFDAIKFVPTDELQEGSSSHFKLDAPAWGQPYLERQRMDAINIRNYSNLWFHTDEMAKAIESIASKINKKNYENVILYGLSHGGYGALLFAEQLSATRVLAFAPQVRFEDLDKIEFWRKWRNPSLVEPLYSPPVGYDNCDYYVFYSHNCDYDREIITNPEGLPRMVKNKERLIVYPLNEEDHNVAAYLKKNKLLKEVVDLVDKGDKSKLNDVMAEHIISAAGLLDS